MARRSARVSAASAASVRQASAKTTPLGSDASPAQKMRGRPKVPATSKGLPVRTTTKKSRFFEDQGSNVSGTETTPEASDDVYEETEGEEEDTASEPESPGTDDSDEYGRNSGRSKRRKSGRPAASNKKRKASTEETDTGANEVLKGKELWREGVRTGLGPGKEVFIKKPKARDTGGIPYRDNVIHPNTMLFLQDLKKHNEREWMKAHDADYRASKADWETFVESLTEKIIEQDETIPELPAKDLVFRIHRDIRFSKDPTPYKIHYSAAWSRTGRKGPYAAYYVHLQPGSCFIGAGLWMPEASRLALIREDIDRHSGRIKSVLRDARVRREFLRGTPDNEAKAVRAFADQNKESALKVRPKGYEADNPNIELLRLRSFTLGKALKDEDLLSEDSQDKIARLIGVLVPFVTYLNSVVMPDAANEAQSSDDGEDEDN